MLSAKFLKQQVHTADSTVRQLVPDITVGLSGAPVSYCTTVSVTEPDMCFE